MKEEEGGGGRGEKPFLSVLRRVDSFFLPIFPLFSSPSLGKDSLSLARSRFVEAVVTAAVPSKKCVCLLLFPPSRLPLVVQPSHPVAGEF